jgi:transcription antitermination factor NusG
MLMGNERQQLRSIESALRATEPATLDATNEMVMIIARPGQEQRGRDSLRRRGIGVWWPNYSKEVIYKNKQTGRRARRLVLSAVMPGIMLSPAKFSDDFWIAMDLAPGVVNVARKRGGDLLVLSEIDVVLIHKIEAGLNEPPPTKPVHSFKIGDKVRFVDDVMRRLPAGKMTKVMRSGHIGVDVSVLGRLTSFDVLPHQIEAAS